MKTPEINPTHRALFRQQAKLGFWTRMERHAASFVLFSVISCLLLWVVSLTTGLHRYDFGYAPQAIAGGLTSVGVLAVAYCNGRRHRAMRVYQLLELKAARGD